jgi:hypothetical protein
MTKGLLIIAVLLLLTAFATCYFGVRYDAAQIPQRQQMTDFDWIGVTWVQRGMAVAAVALAAGCLAGILHWIHVRRSAH